MQPTRRSGIKICMAKLILLAVFWTLLLSAVVFAHEANDEKVTLPDEVMRQVVGRILTYQFKPRRSPTTIPLAESQVKHEWLPDIQNIAFELVSDEKVGEYEKGVFLFEGIERDGNLYSINVGWGDFDCFAFGDTWRFKLDDKKIRLWLKGGWGRGCGHSGSSPPTVRGLELGTISPNELPGFEFFRKGKLKDIRLGFSTREDIKNTFGNDCTNTCKYDENWSIRAHYISEGLSWTTTVGDDKTEYFAKEEFVGKLESLILDPMKPASFNSVVFPRSKFSNGTSNAIGDAWGINGFEGAVHTTYQIYSDGYGLQYTVYDEETFNNLKNKSEEEKKWKKGDLISIEYSIPNSLKNKVYYGRPVSNDKKFN